MAVGATILFIIDTKMDHKDELFAVNEVCEMKNCNKCIFLEMRKKQDAYMW